MIDKSKRFVRKSYPLSEVTTLKGKQAAFDSIAEMLTVRAREIPDAVHVLYDDEVITYSQTNERANRVARYLREQGVDPVKP